MNRESAGAIPGEWRLVGCGHRRAPLGWIRTGLLALALTWSACVPVRAKDAGPPEKVVLALKWFHQFQFAGYYAAQAQGYYAAEGLDVDIREPLDRRAPIETVPKGEANYGVAAADLLQARGRGAPVVALAVIFQHSPVVVLSRADRNLHMPSDLVGKTVMIEENTEVEFKALMLREGLPLDAVRLAPHTWRVDEIIGGQVDASVDYVIDEPNRMRQRGVEPGILKPIDYGIDFYGDCLFTSERELRRHPERVEAFRRASVKGWEYALAHVDETIAQILELPGVKARGVTADHLRYEAEQTALLIQPTLVEIGHVNPGRWQRMADTYLELGLLDGKFSLDGFLYRPPNGNGAVRWTLYLLAGLLAGVVGVGAVAMLWNRQLRRSVKHSTRELRESQEYLKSVLDASNDAVFVHDAATARILDVNQRMLEMYGCTRAQALQAQANDFSEGQAPYSATEALAWLKKARDEGPQIFLWRARRASGELFWTEISARFVIMGGAPRYVVMVRDVTERKQAEAELAESAGRFRTLIDTVPGLAIHGYLLDGTAIYWNAACTRLYGYTAEEAIGKNLLDLVVPPELREAIRANVQAMKLGATHFPPGELVLQRKNGSRVHVYSGYAVIRPITQPAQFFCMDVDLTERLETEKALRESESRFRLLIDTVPDLAIQGYLMDGTVAYWNKTSERLYGYSAEEAIGRNLLELIIPPELRENVSAAIRSMAATGRAIPPRELNLRRKDDTRVSVYSGHAVIKAPGQPDHFFCMDIDLTDRKRTEDDKRRLQEQLAQAQKMESIGRLAGGVAHDFNNMLGVIVGYAELAMEQVDSAQPIHGDLQEILKAARRSTDLTRQLLAYARKQAVAPKVLDLNETIAGSLKMLRRLIGEGLELTWQPGAPLWPVKMDPVQIDQILTNLCVNARDAIRDVGRISIQTGNLAAGESGISLRAGWVPGDYVWLSVGDTGSGMDEELLGHLFEPFFTTKGMGRGTGLGLATVYGIVKQNKGFIDVQSKLGQGSTFTVYLPRHEGTMEPEETAVPEPAALPAGGQTLLLVEDELSLLGLCQSCLLRQGYRVMAASSPAEALQLAEACSDPIHLLVTDVVMPGMNGWELSRRLLESHPGLKSMFMSGFSADVMAQQGVLKEGLHFLQKPFTQADLIAMVQDLLAES